MWDGPEMPELEPGLMIWWDDFSELSTDRQLGVSAGPIPHSTIAAHTMDWDDDEAEMFRVCMRRMDAAYLEFDPKDIVKVNPIEMTPQDRLKAIFGDNLNG